MRGERAERGQKEVGGMANCAGEASYLLSNSCCKIALGTIQPRESSTPFHSKSALNCETFGGWLCDSSV